MVEGLYCATGRGLVPSGILVRMELEEVLLCILALEVERVNGSVDCLRVLCGALCEENELEVWVELNEHFQQVGAEAQVGRLLLLPLLCLPAEHKLDGRCLQVFLLGMGLRRGKKQRLVNIKDNSLFLYI